MDDLNICWKNIPPAADAYWAYSSRNDKNSYHFMSAADCMNVEFAYQRGDEVYRFSNGNTIRFREMRQYTACGDCHRYIKRLTAQEFQARKQLYLEYFANRDHYWCLDCKTGYVLYAPAYQTILDCAYADNKTVTIELTQSYSYDIDPFHGTQRNNTTGKIRKVANVQRNTNTKPIYGAYLVKLLPSLPAPAPTQAQTLSISTRQTTEHTEADENSCIYTSATNGNVSTDPAVSMDASCIYRI